VGASGDREGNVAYTEKNGETTPEKISPFFAV